MSPDPRKIDSLYRPFPSIDDWLRTEVLTDRWDTYAQRVRQWASTDPEVLRRAYEIVRRVAAIETGAVEELYDVNRGFTLTVATQSALWEAALSEKGDAAKALITAQLEAYEYVLDFATGTEPIALAWIRELHNEICSGQEHYLVQTEAGPQRHRLPLGEYKTLPNHVQIGDDKFHAYAPVELTSAEMQRFSREIHKKAFEQAHPAQQASYAHYAVVAIHPFADGNGRVARALASVFTYRAESIPLLVHAADRREYFDALAAADGGRFQPFVNFSVDRCLAAMELVEQSMRAARLPPAASTLAELDELYITRGGFSVEDVDAAASRLMGELEKELAAQLEPLGKLASVAQARASRGQTKYEVPSDRYRVYLARDRGDEVTIQMTPKAPAKGSIARRFRVEIPKDCGERDDFRVRVGETDDVFTARMSELHPNVREALLMRLKVFCQRQVDRVAADLLDQVRSAGRPDV